jgi:hypothetical protein
MTINVSKRWDFNPNGGELVLNAFRRVGISPSEITQEHMYQARLSANFILAEMSNQQPNLWTVNEQTVPIIQGVATVSVPAQTVMITDLYVRTGDPPTDRYLNPISRTEWASYPNKTTQGFPTVYWFDRLISPTITLWPVPDGNGPYLIKYFSVRQSMDAVLQGGLTVEVPYRWLDTFVCGLAWKLAELYAPDKEAFMLQKYERSWKISGSQDTERPGLMIQPGLSGYFR